MAARFRGSQSLTILETPPSKEELEKKKKKKEKKLSARKTLTWLTVLLIALYVTCALAPRYCLWLQSALIYVHYVKIPYFTNISNPAEFGLETARQFDLVQYDGCVLKVWQLLPRTFAHQTPLSDEDYEHRLSDGAPIILYLHGNTGTRATPHRVAAYKFLTETKGYHVVTFDYRGYAESECHPSERGMMEDGLLVWRWIKKHAPNSKLYLWGHSLGSAAATYLAKELSGSGHHPEGLVLDAPFTNMVEAAAHHPFGIPFWPIMPLFRYFVLQSFKERFDSASRLKDISCPILILHGRGDIIIPFHIGERMYRIAQETRKANPHFGKVEFVDCGDTVHKTNYKSPLTSTALDRFIGQD